jgi:uncharacterized protein involved in tellurium resistance
MLPVFSGNNFGYLYETEHYLLHDKDFKTHIYLQGDDARIFREEIKHIDSLLLPQSNDGRLTENIIGLYL